MQRFGQMLGNMLRGALGVDEEEDALKPKIGLRRHEGGTEPFIEQPNQQTPNLQLGGLFGNTQSQDPIDALAFSRPTPPPTTQTSDMMYRNPIPQMPQDKQVKDLFNSPEARDKRAFGVTDFLARRDNAGNPAPSGLQRMPQNPDAPQNPGLQKLFNQDEQAMFPTPQPFEQMKEPTPQPVDNPMPSVVDQEMQAGIAAGQSAMQPKPVEGMPANLNVTPPPVAPVEINPADAMQANNALNQDGSVPPPMAFDKTNAPPAEQESYWGNLGEGDFNPETSGSAGPPAFVPLTETEGDTSQTGGAATDKKGAEPKAKGGTPATTTTTTGKSVLKTGNADPTQDESLDRQDIASKISSAPEVEGVDGKKYKKVNLGDGRTLYVGPDGKEVTDDAVKKRIDRAEGRTKRATERGNAKYTTEGQTPNLEQIETNITNRKNNRTTAVASLESDKKKLEELKKQTGLTGEAETTRQNQIQSLNSSIASRTREIAAIDEELGKDEKIRKEYRAFEEGKKFDTRADNIERLKDIAETRDLTPDEQKELEREKKIHFAATSQRIENEVNQINARLKQLKKKANEGDLTEAEIAEQVDLETKLNDAKQRQKDAILEMDPEFNEKLKAGIRANLSTTEKLKLEIAEVTAGTHKDVQQEGGFWKRLGSGLWRGFAMWVQSGGQGGLGGLAAAVGTAGMGSAFSKRFEQEMRKNSKLQELFGKFKQEQGIEAMDRETIEARQKTHKEFINAIKEDGIITEEEAAQYEELIGAPIAQYDAREWEATERNGRRYLRPKKGGPASVEDTSVPVDITKVPRKFTVTDSDGKKVELEMLPKDIADWFSEQRKADRDREKFLFENNVRTIRDDNRRYEDRLEAYEESVVEYDGFIERATARIEEIDAAIADIQADTDMDEDEARNEINRLRRERITAVGEKRDYESRRKGLKKPTKPGSTEEAK